MPNSAWTETGSSISLVPVTTPIDPGSSPNNVNYLTNANKIALMAQYTAELAMKTSLDTLASTWSVASTFYDSAVAAISTALINAGAPSNWATTWPDGTTSGPWTGIQTSLANLWAQVATQRTALQSSISAAQASAAFAASLAVPTVVSSLPSLPSSSYPSGAYVFNTSTNMMYQSTGSAWVALTVAGSSLVANSVTAAQIAANTITAAQISSGYVYAGSISANQITTGTLNAASVAVTNLNASNITTGTLSATMVLFADGTELTTASRVVTSTATLSASVSLCPSYTSIFGAQYGIFTCSATGTNTVTVNSNNATSALVGHLLSMNNVAYLITGYTNSSTITVAGPVPTASNVLAPVYDIGGITITTATAADVINLQCLLSVANGGYAATITTAVSVDGAAPINAVQGYIAAAAGTYSVPYCTSLTGLAGGAHTISLQVNSSSSGASTKAYVLALRIF